MITTADMPLYRKGIGFAGETESKTLLIVSDGVGIMMRDGFYVAVKLIFVEPRTRGEDILPTPGIVVAPRPHDYPEYSTTDQMSAFNAETNEQRFISKTKWKQLVRDYSLKQFSERLPVVPGD